MTMMLLILVFALIWERRWLKIKKDMDRIRDNTNSIRWNIHYD